MAEQWIPAVKALQIVNDASAICSRLHAGVLRSRANLLEIDGEQRRLEEIPRGFWWAEGNETLEQDWERGDFAAVLDDEHGLKAFGVSIGLFGLLEMVPFQQRSGLVRSLSIAGNSDWISAQDVRRLAHANGKHKSAQFIVEQARLGFISGKAVEAKGVEEHNNFTEWDWEEREWPIPIWFWAEFTIGKDAMSDWELGRFSGYGAAPNGSRLIELNGVHFLKTSVEAIFDLDDSLGDKAGGQPRGRKPVHDWPKASNAIWGKINRGDLQPTNQAQIEKAFIIQLTRGDREPSESTVRPYAKVIWDEFRKA